MTVYVVFSCDFESSNIYAVCASASKAQEQYAQLKQKLINEAQHMIEFVEKKDRDSSVYTTDLERLHKCEFPDVTPNGYMTNWLITKVYEVLE